MKSLILATKKYSLTDYHKMIEIGIIKGEDKVELIRGEIVKMSPVGLKHATCVKKLNQLFSQKLGTKVILGIQDPIKLNDNSEPQPDVVLLKPKADFYATEHPKPEDIFLLIEVADSSIEYDQQIKIPLYAENNITEMWLVNINENIIQVYQNPQGKLYKNITNYQINDQINITIFSDFNFDIQVKDIL
jgi:Uma2 family endonuclease